VDLILTGSFSNSLFPKGTGKRSFIFDGTDSKLPDLVDKYGEDILGLSQEKFDELQKNHFAGQLRIVLKQNYRV